MPKNAETLMEELYLSLGMTPEKLAHIKSIAPHIEEKEFHGKPTVQVGKQYGIMFGAAKAEHLVVNFPGVISWYLTQRGAVETPENKELQKKIKSYMKLTDCSLEEATAWAVETFTKA